MTTILLNISGSDEDILNLFAMCFSFCLTSEIQTGLSTGIMAQIKTQILPKCQKIIEENGMIWKDYLKELEAPIRAEIAKM